MLHKLFPWDIVIGIDDFEFSSQFLSRYLWACVGPLDKNFLQDLAKLGDQVIFLGNLEMGVAYINKETLKNNRRNLRFSFFP